MELILSEKTKKDILLRLRDFFRGNPRFDVILSDGHPLLRHWPELRVSEGRQLSPFEERDGGPVRAVRGGNIAVATSGVFYGFGREDAFDFTDSKSVKIIRSSGAEISFTARPLENAV